LKKKFSVEIQKLNHQVKAQETKIKELKAKRLDSSIQDDFLMNSLCTNDLKEKQFLRNLFKNKILVTNVLYRASQDGWHARDFHSKCDS